MNIPKGTEIRCHRKRHLIGTTKMQLGEGSVVAVSKVISFVPGQEKQAGDKLNCSICGGMYYEQGNIHTADGWIPQPPYIEPVTRRKL